MNAGGHPPVDDAVTLRRMLDISLAVAAERRTEPVLRVILDSARDLTGARYAAVGVPDGGGGFATFLTSGVDAATWAAIGALPRQHGMLAILLRDPSSVRLVDIQLDERFAGWPAAHPDMHAFLGVPIVAGGEIVAELYLADTTDGRAGFDAEDQAVVEMLAAHAALAIVNAQRLERTRELTLAEERTRMARDLHDSVTQTLFSLTLAAETTGALVGAAAGADARLRTEIERVQELAADALAEMRDLVVTLRPPPEQTGLRDALTHRVELLQRVHDVPIRLRVDGGDMPTAPVQRELLLLASEALANALAHAEASTVDLSLSLGETATLRVRDDGVGFDPVAVRRVGSGLGLVSMRERVDALGGRLRIETAPGQGTTVEIEVGGA